MKRTHQIAASLAAAWPSEPSVSPRVKTPRSRCFPRPVPSLRRHCDRVLALVAASLLAGLSASCSSPAGSDGPAKNVGEGKTTVGDMRTIATACESFTFENGNKYPGQSEPASVAAIAKRLEPTYLKRVPIRDEWGNDFLYWSDGDAFVLASAGSDGKWESPTRDYKVGTCPRGGRVASSEDDLVFSNGEFLQGP